MSTEILAKPKILLRRQLQTLAVGALVFFFIAPRVFSQQAGANVGGASLIGEATVQTNRIERGITQTNGDPSVAGQAIIHLGPQFTLGIGGGNVRYPSGTEHLRMHLLAAINVPVSSSFKFDIIYLLNRYYTAGDRNGNEFGIKFDFSGYTVAYEQLSNWENIGKAKYVKAGKLFPINGNWKWEIHGGYIMPEETYSTAFDVKTGVIMPNGNISYFANITWVSSQNVSYSPSFNFFAGATVNF